MYLLIKFKREDYEEAISSSSLNVSLSHLNFSYFFLLKKNLIDCYFIHHHLIDPISLHPHIMIFIILIEIKCFFYLIFSFIFA